MSKKPEWVCQACLRNYSWPSDKDHEVKTIANNFEQPCFVCGTKEDARSFDLTTYAHVLKERHDQQADEPTVIGETATQYERQTLPGPASDFSNAATLKKSEWVGELPECWNVREQVEQVFLGKETDARYHEGPVTETVNLPNRKTTEVGKDCVGFVVTLAPSLQGQDVTIDRQSVKDAFAEQFPGKSLVVLLGCEVQPIYSDDAAFKRAVAEAVKEILGEHRQYTNGTRIQ